MLEYDYEEEDDVLKMDADGNDCGWRSELPEHVIDGLIS